MRPNNISISMCSRYFRTRAIVHLLSRARHEGVVDENFRLELPRITFTSPVFMKRDSGLAFSNWGKPRRETRLASVPRSVFSIRLRTAVRSTLFGGPYCEPAGSGTRRVSKASTPRSGPHQHLRRCKITTGIENNEGERYGGEGARPDVGGQAKGLRARGGKDSELADGKMYGNNDATERAYVKAVEREKERAQLADVVISATRI